MRCGQLKIYLARREYEGWKNREETDLGKVKWVRLQRASGARKRSFNWEHHAVGFPNSPVGKESAYNAGDPGSIPESGRSAGEGIGYPLQYSWASLVAQLVKNLPAMWETCVPSLGWEDPLEKGKATHSSILAEGIPWATPMGLHLGASLIAQSVKNLPAMQETRVRFLGWEYSLEKEMATYSSIFACRIAWTEEPGKLQSMGSQQSDTS